MSDTPFVVTPGVLRDLERMAFEVDAAGQVTVKMIQRRDLREVVYLVSQGGPLKLDFVFFPDAEEDPPTS